MKTNGHTPGPWKWDQPSNWFGLQARVCTETYEPIAAVEISGWPRKQGPANAALISAAPDLLAACEMAFRCLSQLVDSGELHDKLNAAMIKARGE